ncbi:multicomponent Na+:H+ antiporter subunit E [Devosia sp. UYZn731]|uniref:Na+/H+ antiporter subunit E n=1 Tax=Devosia sp. UYZn731 TaxID=3156345 RepID=UPI003396F17A
MNFALLTIVLALLWAALTGNFSGPNLLLGAAIALASLLLLRGRIGQPSGLRRVIPAILLAVVFLHELLLSAIKVALVVMAPNLRAQLRPAIVAVPLTVKSDLEITLLANLITLTPGTLSIDVSDDKSVLYVHVLILEDRARLISGIAQGFEKRIMAVFA